MINHIVTDFVADTRSFRTVLSVHKKNMINFIKNGSVKNILSPTKADKPMRTLNHNGVLMGLESWGNDKWRLFIDYEGDNP